ncbi:MAG: hypothetical protein HUU03_04290 [Planctomycetaceae bacterium]|nr:hypothetical protein [Planctomycetaceae bacterium]HRJ79862.1 hypothetical protein [Planctomycetota bacterium]
MLREFVRKPLGRLVFSIGLGLLVSVLVFAILSWRTNTILWDNLATSLALFALHAVFVHYYLKFRQGIQDASTEDLDDRAREVRAELASMREEQKQTLEVLRERLELARHEAEVAQGDKERLMRELHEMLPDAPGDASATFLLDKAHEAVSRRAQAQTRVASREADILRSRAEVEELQRELSAAEALLSESDRRAAELDRQLLDQNRELWKLKAEVQGAQSHARDSRLKTMMLTRSHIKKGEHTLRMLEEMLKRWIRSGGQANVNFSSHGHASEVAAQFEKIDRDFIDRFFAHVTNPEYERGQHRAIRVRAGEDPDGGRFGELVVALDDDAGRTLGLRFDLRKEAPDARHVGFVLALLLKALSRDLREFAVIVK